MAGGSKVFGDCIKELRNALKEKDDSFSLRGVAEKMGVSPTYLSKIERGELPPSDDAVYKLAKVLNVSSDELFAKIEKIEPELEKQLAKHESPAKMAAFLRTASNLSKERLEMFQRMIDATENMPQENEESGDNAEKI